MSGEKFFANFRIDFFIRSTYTDVTLDFVRNGQKKEAVLHGIIDILIVGFLLTAILITTKETLYIAERILSYNKCVRSIVDRPQRTSI